jgi:glucose-1-phosphate thymidylyltransferase
MRAKSIQQNIVGLIPAAGTAERLAPLPCSKEIYPVGSRGSHQHEDLRTKVVSEYLLESLQLAEIDKVYIILRKGKWDIPQYLGSGRWMDMDFAYLIMDLPFGVPFSIDQAYNFVKDDIVFFGFPDIIFRPHDAFIQLLEKQYSKRTDVVLGLFPAPQPYKKAHMVKIDHGGQVGGFEIEPSQTTLKYTWIIAVWSKKFTHFLHEYVSIESALLKKRNTLRKDSSTKEILMTQAFDAALKEGLIIDSVTFEDGTFLDIGSPGNLQSISQNISKFLIS